ncbi:MAG: HlyD family type I secretion periplasmic adaptor subunit, partial [Comamonas sp.]
MRWNPNQDAPPPAPSASWSSSAPGARADDGAAVVPLDDRPFARIGWAVLVLGVAGFLLWAALAPLDKGVPAPGTVKVAGNRKAVQPAVDGVVARLRVRDGDTVAAGQEILRLDDTQARAAAQALRIQAATAQATVDRLAAERDGLGEIAFAPGLSAARDDAQEAARVREALALQRQLLSARRQALDSELAAMRETVAAYEAELAGLRETREARRQQRAALAEQAGGLRELARDGFVSRNRLLDAERMLAQLDGALAEDAGRLGALQRQAAEQRLRIAQRRQAWQAEVRGQLADAELQAHALADKLRAAEFQLDATVLRAPAAGRVVGLAVFTEGGVVRAGERLMEVVPEGQPLVVEGQVPVDLIDRVHAGLPVDLMFTAFNQNRTPHVEGRVTVVGADRLVEERSGIPYFPLEVEVAPESRDQLAGLDLRPGMPVEVFVRTGERSLLSYLLKPLVDRA